MRWGVGVDPTKQEDGGLVWILTMGPKGKTINLFSPTAPPPFVLPGPQL